MSWRVQAVVGERVCGSITRKMVLLNMASRANDDGTGVYASLSMIAGWCEVDARTVRRIVRDLESEGLIIQCGWKTVKNGQINEWRVDVEAIERLPLYKDEVAAKRLAKSTPDTVSGVVKKTRKSRASKNNPGHTVRPDIKTARTYDPQTPDTAPASSILEPNSLFEEANASPNKGTVVQLRPGEGSEAIALYAEVAKRCGWIAPKGRPSAKRQQAIRSRLRECGGLAGWRQQLSEAEAASFLGGDNDRGWRMDLDFFASPRGWTAIAEGKYLRAPTLQFTSRVSSNDYIASTADTNIRRDKVSLATAARERDRIRLEAQSRDRAVNLGRVESHRID